VLASPFRSISIPTSILKGRQHMKDSWIFGLCILALGGSAPAAGGDAYVRPRLLIEAPDLQKALPGGDLVVLDARKKPDFEKGRVPGARWVDAAAWAKEFGKGDDAKGWGRRIGALGIGPRTRVVVYDETHFKDAARMWWILRYWGVEDAALLNGNWPAWKAGSFPVETGPEKTVAPSEFPAAARAERLADKAKVLDVLKTGKRQIVDARSEAEFCGTDAQKNRMAGAMPGALLLEWIDLIDKPTQRFKPAGELRKLFADAGIDPAKPIVTHCQSGGRASVMVFALELLGAVDVENYYASWAEWGNDDETPVVKGKAREKK
jgi:thiosulfate/3-mercaptopyruvate sulfurtransferase